MEILENFGIRGTIKGYKFFTNGHINTTCLGTVEVDGKEKKLVLQKINKYVFRNPEEVMENIANVTGFIRDKLKAKGRKTSRRVLKFYPAESQDYFTIDEDGEYWRLCKYIGNSKTFNSTDNLTILEETGKAFGEFQNLLSDYPSSDLNIVIPHFHNTPRRYETFKEVVSFNPVGRVKEVEEEIQEYLRLEEIASKMYQMQKRGELRLRVTHNDTKCNNVLFDNETDTHLCVIDLDTVMPGLVGFDFGDAIRFGASTCDEDERDIDNVKIDLEKYRAFARGFLSEVGDSLTENEKKTLSLGAITMTIECGLRFLTDYIDGDNYFKTEYSEHNLVRSRCQLALAKDMIKNYQLMQEVIANCEKAVD